MNLAITLHGTEYNVQPKPGDLVRFERQYDVPASSLDENTKLEHVLFIAWTCLKREGNYEGDFESFLDLADVGVTGPLDPPTPPL